MFNWLIGWQQRRLNADSNQRNDHIHMSSRHWLNGARRLNTQTRAQQEKQSRLSATSISFDRLSSNKNNCDIGWKRLRNGGFFLTATRTDSNSNRENQFVNEFSGPKILKSLHLHSSKLTRCNCRRKRRRNRHKLVYDFNSETFIDVLSYEKVNTFHVCVRLPLARSPTALSSRMPLRLAARPLLLYITN